MSQTFVLFILCPLIVIVGLFLLAYAGVHAVFSVHSRADRKQQAEYEVEEWERHIGKERATLLRGAGHSHTDPGELLRSAVASPETDPDSLAVRPARPLRP